MDTARCLVSVFMMFCQALTANALNCCFFRRFSAKSENHAQLGLGQVIPLIIKAITFNAFLNDLNPKSMLVFSFVGIFYTFRMTARDT